MLKKALESNKEDTKVIAEELGVVSSDIANLEELVAFYKKEVESRIKKGELFQSLDYLSGLTTAAGAFLIYEGVKTDNTSLTNTGYILTGVGAAGFITLHFTWRIE